MQVALVSKRSCSHKTYDLSMPLIFFIYCNFFCLVEMGFSLNVDRQYRCSWISKRYQKWKGKDKISFSGEIMTPQNDNMAPHQLPWHLNSYKLRTGARFSVHFGGSLSSERYINQDSGWVCLSFNTILQLTAFSGSPQNSCSSESSRSCLHSLQRGGGCYGNMNGQKENTM